MMARHKKAAIPTPRDQRVTEFITQLGKQFPDLWVIGPFDVDSYTQVIRVSVKAEGRHPDEVARHSVVLRHDTMTATVVYDRRVARPLTVICHQPSELVRALKHAPRRIK